jgi:hypothetical protein
MAGVFKGFLRLLATIIGVIGAFVALFVNFFNSLIREGLGGHGHLWVGLLLFLVALVGALISWPWPRTAALLMLIAALGFIYVAGIGAVIASPLLLIAAVLAFLDRKKAEPKPAA